MQVQFIQQWYQTEPGSWLLQFEQEQIKRWLPLVRGASVLQLGGLPNAFEMTHHRSQTYCYLASDPLDHQQPGVDALARFDELPFHHNSLNFVLMVHMLEYTEHPTVLLKEVYDVLAPNGKLILFCFNPWSLWGLGRWFADRKKFPWQGKFYSPAKLQHWLSAVGYSNLKDKTLCFRAPTVKRPLSHVSFFIEALGQIAFPMLGAVNVFLAEKRVYGVSPERTYPWKKRRVVNNGMVGTSTRIKY